LLLTYQPPTGAYLTNWLSHPTPPDFLVCPAGPSAAPLHDTARYWGYTAIYNLLDYPACSFPTGIRCSPSLHPKDPSYVPRDNEFDGYNWANYEPKAFEGAPVGLQIVGRRWECEWVLQVAGLLADVMKG
jgi:amidase